jgi:hypothetical protein
MCDILEKPFIEQEVEAALSQMAPNKAPGVDSFNAGFYQTHWQLIKPCVMNVVLIFLNGGGYSRRGKQDTPGPHSEGQQSARHVAILTYFPL